MSNLIGGRYRLDRQIGEGGCGRVHLAFDTWSGERQVALKILLETDSQATARLAREFGLLFRLQHPHIARALAFGRAGAGELAEAPAGTPYFVQEFCPGSASARWALGQAPAMVLFVGAQIAAALAALHTLGVHHGDVKPQNIVVETASSRPTARLIDFGFAGKGPSGFASGTLGYLSPEALAGQAGPAADVYALAATLVHLWSGVAPRSVRGEQLTSPCFGDLIAAMSEPDPARRLGAGEAFEAMLSLSSGALADALVALRDQVTSSCALFGREPILASIDRALDGQAGARVLRLVGAEAIGKTVLLEEAVARAIMRGFTVPGTVRQAVGGGVSELEKALVELRSTFADAAPAAASSAAAIDKTGAAQWQRLAELAEAFAAISRRHRIALVFDDVPIGSPLDAFAGYLARLGDKGPALVFIQASRPPAAGSAAAPPATAAAPETASGMGSGIATGTAPETASGMGSRIATGIASATAIGRAPGASDGRTELLGLDRSAFERLVAAARPLRPRDREVAPALHDASGGNPGRAIVLLKKFPGDSLRRAALDAELARSDAFASAVRAQLEALSPAARRLVAATALVSAAAPLSLLERALGDEAGGADATSAALDEARRSGLVTVREQRDGVHVASAGEAVRRAIAEHAEPAMMHAVLRALDQPVVRESYAADIGLLWRRLGVAERARVPLWRAARDAALAFRLGDALCLYDALLEDAALTDNDRGTAVVESARLLMALGRASEAAERFLAAKEHAEARLGYADALCDLGRFRDAASALAPGGVADPFGIALGRPNGEDVAAVEAMRARALLLAGDYAEAERAVAAAQGRVAPGPHLRAAELESVLGLLAYYRGDFTAAREKLGAALSLADGRGDARLADACRANLAMVLQKALDFAGAEAAYRESVARARERRDLPRQVQRLTNMATLQQDRGAFSAALAGYEEAAELARLIGGRRDLVRVVMNWVTLLVWLGDGERARVLATTALADAHALGMRFEQGYLDLPLCEAALMDGDRGLAHAAVERAVTIFTDSDSKAGLICAEVSRAQVLLYERELERAASVALAAAAAAEQAGRPRLGAQALLWAMLAALDNPRSREAAQSTATRLAAFAERLDDPDIGWIAHAAIGRLHARAGRAVDAELWLTKARQLVSLVRSRIGPSYERAYGEVWFRRELWAYVARPSERTVVAAGEGSKNLDRLLAINRELAQDRDPDRLLERIIDAAIALSGAERGFIILKQPGDAAAAGGEGDGLTIRAARNIDERAHGEMELKFSRSIAIEVIERGLPVSTVDAQGDDRFREQMSVHHLRLRSVLCLPLRAREGVLGALYLDNRHRIDAFSEADVALLTAFGDQAAIALANAQYLAELSQRARELERSRQWIEELNQRLARELEVRSAELELVRARAGEHEQVAEARFGMVGKSAAMRNVYRIIERVADKEVPVSILGESGTGKELVARAIHLAGPRAKGAFVSVNCGAIPSELLESELFGHEKGAFTGAVRSKPGLFEIANGGTIFLDEIGEMPLAMQVKLLRVLQQKELRRVGGTTDVATDARVISASNRDLAAMVRQGGFREDLWYRLNVVEVQVPALRARREDIPLLIDHLLRRHGGKTSSKLSRDALAVLLDYDWPGNVRELENELLRAVALSEGVIATADLSPKLQRHAPLKSKARGGSLKDVVERFERDALRMALQEQGGRISAAARALGLTRAGLYKKLHKYQLLANKS